MDATRPIIILGFGRSGTTWVADIVSKATGGLIAFEPYHPAVCDYSAEVCYAPQYDIDAIDQQWQRVRDKLIRHRWLLRNHLNSPLDGVADEFVDMVWEQSQIIGLKSIRLCHLLGQLAEHWDTRPLVIIRHPLAVIASIRRRTRFWEEYGWAEHQRLYLDRMYDDDRSDVADLLDDPIGMIAYMWAMTHVTMLTDLAQIGGQPYYYEDLYQRPYETAREMLRYVGVDAERLHPSYLFTPSMTTLRTIHDIGSTDGVSAADLSFFWKNDLSKKEIEKVYQIINHVADRHPLLRQLCKDQNYLP